MVETGENALMYSKTSADRVRCLLREPNYKVFADTITPHC